MNRREFLRAVGATSLVFAAPPVLAAARRPNWERVLVLVELNGGNDGLNTIVPYADPQYYQLRPRLALTRDNVLQLSEELGLHPAMEPLMPAWKKKEMAIVLGVGYPQPNRSHFRSIDIWETGSNSEEVWQEGWLARLLAANPLPPGFAAEGIVLGRGLGPLRGSHIRTLVMRDPRQFINQAGRISPTHGNTNNPALAHLLAVQNELHQAAKVLQSKLADTPATTVDFPKTRIGREMGFAAKLLRSRTPVAVLKVSHGSFDTHANQRNSHERLLKQLAEALVVFRRDMVAAGLWDRVLVMTYSEFGRRAGENGSGGTDHGTAAPHLLLGGLVKGGFYGKQPSLTALDNGDLRHHMDYRSLYTTVAQKWWGAKKDFLNERHYPVIDCIA